MRNIFFILYLVFCIGCGDDVVMGGTETEGLLGFCGDRIVNGNEECDEFTENCSGCILNRRIFVTSIMVDGLYPEIFEWKCFSIADDAGLYRGLDWVPWVSESYEAANSSLFRSPFKYERLDGALVAKNFDDLADGILDNPINITENKEILEDRVWTGTKSDGSYSGSNCKNWTDNGEVLGTFGWTNSVDKQWTNAGTVRCADRLHIYCVESENIGINKQW